MNQINYEEMVWVFIGMGALDKGNISKQQLRRRSSPQCTHLHQAVCSKTVVARHLHTILTSIYIMVCLLPQKSSSIAC